MKDSETRDGMPSKPNEVVADPASLAPRMIPSDEILQGRREVWITHGDAVYRLRVTSSGKLYLSK